MTTLILLFIVAILLTLQFVFFKAIAKSAEEEGAGQGRPVLQFFIRYWWLPPVALFLYGILF